MNQNIKAPGQQITVDKLRLKAVNYKNYLRSEVYPLANLNSNALLERWSSLVAPAKGGPP